MYVFHVLLTAERPEPLDIGEEELSKAVGGSGLTIVAARVKILAELAFI